MLPCWSPRIAYIGDHLFTCTVKVDHWSYPCRLSIPHYLHAKHGIAPSHVWKHTGIGEYQTKVWVKLWGFFFFNKSWDKLFWHKHCQIGADWQLTWRGSTVKMLIVDPVHVAMLIPQIAYIGNCLFTCTVKGWLSILSMSIVNPHHLCAKQGIAPSHVWKHTDTGEYQTKVRVKLWGFWLIWHYQMSLYNRDSTISS